MKKDISIVVIGFVVILGLVGLGFLGLEQRQSANNKINILQKEISNLQTVTINIASSTKNAAITAQELANRQQVIQKSQEDTLTSAVAKIAPAVVSIIISENAPKYSVTYVNPFGDDPAFQGLGFEVPVYKQIGTELQKVGAGSGFIISNNGYIITNRHVIIDKKAQYKVLLSDGSQKIAQVVYVDSKNDVAIIKIDGTYPTIASLGDSSTLKLGQTVSAIGNALGEYNNSVSVGIVSGLNRNVTASDQNGNTETLNGIIQTDAAINPGNSGGPLVDLNGDVIGINVATVEGSNNIGFSIPINSVQSIIKNYK
jgi:serine protease Do